MERTVPKTASEEIDLYIRTIYSLLRTSTEVQVRSFEEVHAGMNSSLHPDARKQTPDTSAFIYSSLRLPTCIADVNTIVLGQTSMVFSRHGYPGVEKWRQVSSKARRRASYFDMKGILAVFIASQSDIEDVIPLLTAFQIEWNKIHLLLQEKTTQKEDIQTLAKDPAELARALTINFEDAGRLLAIWGKASADWLSKIVAKRLNLRIRLLSGSLSEYRRATQMWWDHIETHQPKISSRPVYFISSNPHSITNLLTSFALRTKAELVDFVKSGSDASLIAEWQDLLQQRKESATENFYYYVLKKWQNAPKGKDSISKQSKDEMDAGIHRIPSAHSFDVETQVIHLNQLNYARLDPRLELSKREVTLLSKSEAILVNIDYPLGLGAYHILIKLAEHLPDILGVYIMGKAASLNGVRGDVMIPGVVQDEHSQNTYLFQNVFSAADLMPYLSFGSVLDNQKALTVLGTFLQNSRYMDVMYREGYTDIEMEAGPYLSAIYEMTRPKRYPINEIVNLQGTPFDVGILHYASDTPLSKGRNLGAGTLSYQGVESTYACSLAILKRIFSQEVHRLTEPSA